MGEINVFVYGTLKIGHANHSFLKGAKFIGCAEIPENKFIMMDLGPYPALTPARGSKSPTIKGELFAVDEEGLKKLDYLEGYPDFYDRLVENVKMADQFIYTDAIVYYIDIIGKDNRIKPIISGEWNGN